MSSSGPKPGQRTRRQDLPLGFAVGIQRSGGQHSLMPVQPSCCQKEKQCLVRPPSGLTLDFCQGFTSLGYLDLLKYVGWPVALNLGSFAPLTGPAVCHVILVTSKLV